MQTLTDGPMTVEVYDRDVTQDEMESLELASVMDEYAKRMDLAKGLGLEAQVSALNRKRLVAQLKASVPFEYLDGETLKVWEWYLPTKYGDKGILRNITQYAFDLIPFSVLELWQSCKDRQVFDAYDIWTPERQRPDPILVGYKTVEQATIGPWLIARWGESLQAFSEIQEEVKQMGVPPPQIELNEAVSFALSGSAFSGNSNPLGSFNWLNNSGGFIR